MDGPILEPEQRQLFSAFVEVLRSRPRSEREEFMVIRAQADLIQGNGFSGEVLGSDILHLGEVGLLRITDYHRRGSGFNFYIPPEGLEYYQHLKGQTDEPVEQVETEVRTTSKLSGMPTRMRTTYGGKPRSCCGGLIPSSSFSRSATSAGRRFKSSPPL